jgi:endoglycosylceramidase
MGSALLGVLLSTLGALAPLHTDGRFFKDDRGGVVVLRGVNLSGTSKVPPFLPLERAVELDPLPRWGMNVVRLLFTWEAYEPAPSRFDGAYLERIAAVARWAGARGLYVIVDFHQDALSRSLLGGCGDGFPPWIVPDEVEQSVPDNGVGCRHWGPRMIFDAGVHVAWHAFFRDVNGARAHYVDMVRGVAERMRREPAVIGYDMLNEPMGDEATELSGLYEELAASLREAHPGAILFVSPHAATSAGLRSRLPRPGFDNFAYAPHYYDPLVVTFKAWLGCRVAAPVARMVAQAARFDAPLFLGEFGAPAGTWRGRAYMERLFVALDAGLVSGAQWVYTPGWSSARRDGWNAEDFSITARGEPRANFQVRPFPPRVAGTPVMFRVTRDAVELTWDHVPAVGETVLFAPAAHVPSGCARVDAAPAGTGCSYDGAHVRCTSGVAGRKVVRVVADRCTFAGPALTLPAAEVLDEGVADALEDLHQHHQDSGGQQHDVGLEALVAVADGQIAEAAAADDPRHGGVAHQGHGRDGHPGEDPGAGFRQQDVPDELPGARAARQAHIDGALLHLPQGHLHEPREERRSAHHQGHDGRPGPQAGAH